MVIVINMKMLVFWTHTADSAAAVLLCKQPFVIFLGNAEIPKQAQVAYVSFPSLAFAIPCVGNLFTVLATRIPTIARVAALKEARYRQRFIATAASFLTHSRRSIGIVGAACKAVILLALNALAGKVILFRLVTVKPRTLFILIARKAVFPSFVCFAHVLNKRSIAGGLQRRRDSYAQL